MLVQAIQNSRGGCSILHRLRGERALQHLFGCRQAPVLAHISRVEGTALPPAGPAHLTRVCWLCVLRIEFAMGGKKGVSAKEKASEKAKEQANAAAKAAEDADWAAAGLIQSDCM